MQPRRCILLVPILLSLGAAQVEEDDLMRREPKRKHIFRMMTAPVLEPPGSEKDSGIMGKGASLHARKGVDGEQQILQVGTTSPERATSTPEYVLELQRKLYPGIQPMSQMQKLPLCAKHLKIYIYNLSSKWNVDLVREMELHQGRSNCDWARTPCAEVRQDAQYSHLRNHAGEVPMLFKFLSFPNIVSDPTQADLIIVPYLMRTHAFALGEPYGTPEKAIKSKMAIRQLVGELHLMSNASLRKRHVFMSSSDAMMLAGIIPQQMKDALLLHYGPRRSRNELVMVPNDAGFGRSLEPLVHPAPDFIFYQAGDMNEPRHLMKYELQRLQKDRPELRIHHYTIGNHKPPFPLDLSSTYALMSRSLLCPVMQGDTPWQHRFYDALVTGCVPLLVRYRKRSNNGMCDVWSYSSSYTKSDRHAPKSPPCIEDVYPFTAKVNYTEITVQIEESSFRKGSFAEAIYALDRRELEAKRKRLEELRHLFVYDWTSTSYDASSAMIEDLCRVINTSASP